VTKSKTVETIKDLRSSIRTLPKRDRLEFSRLSKNRSRVGGKSVLIFADAPGVARKIVKCDRNGVDRSRCDIAQPNPPFALVCWKDLKMR
jgi:hypothetical protein